MKLKMFAAASLAMAMGNAAQAAIAVDQDAPPLGEVFLAVWDVTGTNPTYVQDLGVSARGTDWSTATLSFTVDSAAYNSALGTSSAGNLRYALYAGVTASDFSYQDVFFTAGSGFNVNTALPGVSGFGDLGQNMINLSDLTNSHNGGSTNYAANVATTALSGVGAIGNNPGSVFNGNFLDGTSPFATFGLLNQALQFFRLGYDLNATDGLNVRSTFASWSFNGQTLSYSAAAPIPLPAGVWLLGSALLGLVGVARRRAEQAA